MTDAVGTISTPIRLDYTVTAGVALTRFLQGLAEQTIRGQRCPRCSKVYVPPRGSCTLCGVPTEEEVEVADAGTVTTFCVVNLPFYGQALEIPYVCGSVLLDGADTAFQWLLQEVRPEDVHMGMRVTAVWADRPGPHMESIRYFKPLGAEEAAA